MSEDGDDKAGAPRGRIGVEIFERVEELVKNEGLTRTQAFERISEETDRRAGTVAANYSRVARQRGAALQPRTPRAGRRGRAAGRGRAASSDVEAALTRVTTALDELAKAVRRQDQELAKLREQSEQLERLRVWMDKNVS